MEEQKDLDLAKALAEKDKALAEKFNNDQEKTGSELSKQLALGSGLLFIAAVVTIFFQNELAKLITGFFVLLLVFSTYIWFRKKNQDLEAKDRNRLVRYWFNMLIMFLCLLGFYYSFAQMNILILVLVCSGAVFFFSVRSLWKKRMN